MHGASLTRLRRNCLLCFPKPLVPDDRLECVQLTRHTDGCCLPTQEKFNCVNLFFNNAGVIGEPCTGVLNTPLPAWR